MTSTMQVYIKLFPCKNEWGHTLRAREMKRKETKTKNLFKHVVCIMHMIDHEERNFFFQMFLFLFL